ncbi:MtnX-like HAD-IB family phosphatase [Chloroflexota bacterium]
MKTVFQCDFDGTITEQDISFLMLDTFAGGDWRRLFREYQEGRISVGHFNRAAFSMVKADRQSLLEAVMDKVKIRPGFQELVAYCRKKGLRFVIVSNGLDFYIEEILRGIGMADIETFAAETQFHPGGLKVRYIGPDGNYLDDGFKLAYVNSYLNGGNRILYAGNGASDFPPAKQCQHAFATGGLIACFKQADLDFTPFTDFNEVVRVLELW